MFISKVLSHLGAWQKLQNDLSSSFSEIEKILASVDFPGDDDSRAYRFGRRDMDKAFKAAFSAFNWKAPNRVDKYTWWYEVEYTNGKVGIEYDHLGYEYIQNFLFITAPVLIQAGLLKVIIILAPTHNVRFRKHRNSFEYTRSHLTEIAPIPLKYPFALVGVSRNKTVQTVEELTSPLDMFLIETVGLSLGEMKIHLERERYDFKEVLPETRRIYHTACALANERNGGIILFGINNDGDIVGLPRSELDLMRRTINDTIRKNCKPNPVLSMFDFDSPFDSDRCVLVVRVEEVNHKPCMADEKVYIRVGSSSQPANSDDIRRLVLHSLTI